MAWDYRLSTLVGAKIWLDTAQRKLRLAGFGGLGSREFNYDELRSVEFQKLNGGILGGFNQILIRTTDASHAFYRVKFRWFGFDAWRARLESELNLLPAIRTRVG